MTRSSVEAEYCAMAYTASMMIWMRSLHNTGLILMKMHCDNQSTIFIASNSLFHEHTKDYHFIRDLGIKKHIVTPYVQSEDQLGDILTKHLPIVHFLLYIKC